jgi:hypothetical protein
VIADPRERIPDLSPTEVPLWRFKEVLTRVKTTGQQMEDSQAITEVKVRTLKSERTIHAKSEGLIESYPYYYSREVPDGSGWM